jgi:hypothetical protein
MTLPKKSDQNRCLLCGGFDERFHMSLSGYPVENAVMMPMPVCNASIYHYMLNGALGLTPGLELFAVEQFRF